MLVVLDSNAFHGDVRADRSLLRAILDGALAKGAFELFVPEVVLQELDNQFAKRTKKVIREINKAFGERETELRELGLSGPPRMTHDEDDVAGYRAALQERLTRAGAAILPLPADLSPALSWSVHRRKPLKQTGAGFPDVVIWLTVLELAVARDENIVLVTSNTKDFGDGGEPPGLAEELCDDLEERGRPRDQVQLAPGIGAFAEEVGERLESARKRAADLAAGRAFDPAIENALMYSRLDQRTLELGVDLDNDPQVTSWDLEDLIVETAAELPGHQLLVEATAEASVLLDLLIFKADYYLADEDENAYFTLTDPDFNEHYVEAESELVVELELEITTDLEGADAQVELTGVALAPVEVVHRALRRRHLEDLVDAVSTELSGKHVEEYTPDEAIESDVEDAKVLSVYRGGTARLRELIESEDDRHVCHLDVRVDADLEWVVTAPTPFDAEHFAALALNEDSGAPILQGLDSRAPLTVALTAAWDPERGWHDLEISTVSLVEAETKRAARGTAADELLVDLAGDEDD